MVAQKTGKQDNKENQDRHKRYNFHPPNMKKKEVRVGQIWKAKTSNVKLLITSKKSGNGHWNTKKLPKSANSHQIHEGTLNRFYDLSSQEKAH